MKERTGTHTKTTTTKLYEIQSIAVLILPDTAYTAYEFVYVFRKNS